MRKILLISALAFLLAFLAVTSTNIPVNADSGSPLNLSRRVLLSASELDYPPFSVVRNDGSADGFSVELLKAVAGAVGFDVVFKVGPWSEIKRELIDGRIDVLPLVSYSKERDEVFDFSAPYLRMHGTIFIRKDEKSIHGEADLKNKEVLVMRGDTAHEYALGKRLTDKLILTDSFEQAMKELSAGKHDAVLVQRLVGFQLIKKLNIANVVSVPSVQESSLKPDTEPLSGFEQKFCIAVKEGNKELLARLNEGLAIVIASGVYDKLYDKWFGPILPKPSISPAMLLKYFLFVLLPLLGVVGISGFWYLRKEVARKTKRLTEQIETRKAAEQALTQTRDTLQAVLDAAPAGVVVSDRDGRILLASNFTRQIFGGVVTGNAHDPGEGYRITRVDGSPVPEGGMPLSLALRGVTVFDTELLVTRPEGIQSIILASATPLKENENEVWGAVTVFQDITDRKRADEVLQSAHDDLERRVRERTAELEWRNRELQEFASVASHDLQEPLRKIKLFGELVQQELSGSLTEPGRDYLLRMTRAADRMQKLVKALLSYSHVSSKTVPFQRIDLKMIVEKVVEDLDSALGETQALIEIGDLPEIDADPVQISQLFQNLLTNAVRYSTRNRTPIIKISSRSLGAEEGWKKTMCELRVEDKGIGFDMRYLEKIFLPFERLHGSGEYEGTGMGLAICRKIVERHGGEITAQSRPGEGTIFIVTLPMRQTDEPF